MGKLAGLVALLLPSVNACGTDEGMGRVRRQAVTSNSESSELAATTPAVSPERDVGGAPVRLPVVGQFFRIAAGDGSHLLTFSNGQDSEANLFGVRVGFDGTVIDSIPFPISTAPGRQSYPAELASNGTDWLVTWDDQRMAPFDGGLSITQDVYAARVTREGTVRDPNGIPIAVGASAQHTSGVASDGRDFFVVWNDGGVQAAIVDASGVLGRTLTVQQGTAGPSAVGFNGTHYLVAYYETVGSTVYVRAERFTPAGDPVGTVIELGVANATIRDIGIASDGTTWLVRFTDGTSLRWQIVAADGTPGNGGSQSDIYGRTSLTWGGSAYWFAGMATPNSSLRAGLIDAAGNLLDSKIVRQERIADIGFVYGGSTAFLAFWEGAEFPTRGSRIDSMLAMLDAPPITLTAMENWQFPVRAAFGENEFLAVWSDFRDDHVLDGDIAARRLSAIGEPLGSPIVVSSGTARQIDPDVASNGRGYFCVWADSGEIVGTRLSAAGDVVDSEAIVVATGSAPAIASNSKDYYVTWHDGAVRGTRLLASGNAEDQVTLSEPLTTSEHAVASNGSTYLAVWVSSPGIRAARIDSSTGSVLDATRLTIAGGPAGFPQVASDGTDWLVVWVSNTGTLGARVAADGTVGDAIVVDAAATGGGPSVAWTGREYLVSSMRQAVNGSSLYGRRVSAGGLLIDSEPFPIVPDPNLSYQYEGDLTGSGSGRALATYARLDPTRPHAPRAKARLVTSSGAGGGGGSGEGGGAGEATGGSSGAGDGGASGESGSGTGGDGDGGVGDAGAGGSSSGRASGGTAGSTSTGGSSADLPGRKGRTVVTHGCGCRTAGAKGRGDVAMLAAVALGVSCLLRSRKLRIRA